MSHFPQRPPPLVRLHVSRPRHVLKVLPLPNCSPSLCCFTKPSAWNYLDCCSQLFPVALGLFRCGRWADCGIIMDLIFPLLEAVGIVTNPKHCTRKSHHLLSSLFQLVRNQVKNPFIRKLTFRITLSQVGLLSSPLLTVPTLSPFLPDIDPVIFNQPIPLDTVYRSVSFIPSRSSSYLICLSQNLISSWHICSHLYGFILMHHYSPSAIGCTRSITSSVCC